MQNRRDFLRWSCATIAGATVGSNSGIRITFGNDETSAWATLEPLVLPDATWTANELDAFLRSLPDEGRLSMKKSLELLDSDATVADLSSASADVAEVKKEMLWVSHSIATYPFRNADRLDYHELVKWAATKAGVDEQIVKSHSTFRLERALQEHVVGEAFVSLWDRLNEKGRRELLQQMDPDGSIEDHAALVPLSGAATLSALMATVHFSGFAFYTTMSTVMFTVASWAGITLPFAAYTGASTLLAFLTGPVGWALITIATAAGVALYLGAPNVQKTTAAILQLHALKVAALEAVGDCEDKVFEQPIASN